MSEGSFSLSKSFRSPSLSFKEIGVRVLLWVSASISILTTLGIILILCKEVISFFAEVSVIEFFTGTQWTPLLEPRHFGILPLLSGTLLIGVGASMIAVPLGGMTALFLSEYIKEPWRNILKSILEILAGIPTVVYGFFAIEFITPQLQKIFPELQVFNALSAAIVVGIMIIPTVSSVSQDAFQAVPKYLREAAYGLGARKYQVALTVVFPAALSGLIASILLGFSRAIGETMAVSLAAGTTPKLSLNPLQSIQTMTSYIVEVSLGDIPADSLEYKTIFAVGLMLFVMTLMANLAANFVISKFQEKYH